MTSWKSQSGAAGVLIRFLAAFALLLVAFGTNAKDCFELYSDSGATPGSKTCRLDVVGNTPGGMANYACIVAYRANGEPVTFNGTAGTWRTSGLPVCRSHRAHPAGR